MFADWFRRYCFFLMISYWLTLTLTSCTTIHSTDSKRATPLVDSDLQTLDLRKYEVVTILPFQMTEEGADPYIGVLFADDLATRLRNDFGPLFKEVRQDSVLREPNELLVTGSIHEYRLGSRASRFFLIGLDPSSFKADLIIKDVVTDRVLLNVPIDRLWAWGSVIGAFKGIGDLFYESAAAAAATIAYGKGWRNKGD
jgi:hypothetical protein